MIFRKLDVALVGLTWDTKNCTDSRRVVLEFIWLPSPALAFQGVAKRGREGDHNIREAVVRRRYARGLAKRFDLYIPIVTAVCVYDGASFPPIQNAEIQCEIKLVLD